jgi:hypothetical protein
MGQGKCAPGCRLRLRLADPRCRKRSSIGSSLKDPVAQFDFAQHGKITKTTKVTALYVLRDEARQSYTQDLKVRWYYRPPPNPWIVISSVFVTFVIFPYCDFETSERGELRSRL